jgi:hypothetical protein
VRRRLLVAAVLAALPLAACGRKGPPVSPERRLPQAVADVTGVVREGVIELSWVNPGRRVDDTRLRDLAVVRVFRAEDAGRGEPRVALLDGDRVVGYGEVAAIRPAAPAPAVAQGNRLVLTDGPGLAAGRRYTYVLVAGDAQGRWSAPSPRVSVTLIGAPLAPVALRGDPGEQEARLAWQPPTRLLDGGPVPPGLTYQVLRAAAEDAPLEPVTAPTLAGTAHVDRGLENDRTYWYAVRAVRATAGTTAYGAASPRVAVTPRDMTPPAPPTELVAIPAEGAVRLAWRPSPDPDVAAYIVYRASAQGQLVRVGSTRAPGTTFLDRGVPPGPWRYAVTAQDGGARPNESRPSSEASVRVP